MTTDIIELESDIDFSIIENIHDDVVSENSTSTDLVLSSIDYVNIIREHLIALMDSTRNKRIHRCIKITMNILVDLELELDDLYDEISLIEEELTTENDE